VLGCDRGGHGGKHVVDVLWLDGDEDRLRLPDCLGRIGGRSDAVLLAEVATALLMDLADADLLGLRPTRVDEAPDERLPHLAAADDRKLRHKRMLPDTCKETAGLQPRASDSRKNRTVAGRSAMRRMR